MSEELDVVSDDDVRSLEEFEAEMRTAESGDQTPAPEPTTEAPAAGGGAEQQPDGTQSGPPAAPAAEAQPPASDILSLAFTYKGKTKQLKDMTPDEVNQLLNLAGQSGHIQEKYRDLKGKLDEFERRMQAQPKPLDEDQLKVYQERVKAAYTPAITALAKRGAIEPEMVEEFPRTLTTIASGFDSHEARLRRLEQGYSVHTEDLSSRRAAMEQQEARARVGQMLDEISASAPAFAGLADPKHRAAFGQWVQDQGAEFGNLAAEQVTPRLLRAAYAEFLTETGSQPAAAAARPAGSLAGGVAPGRQAQGTRAKNAMDAVMDEFREAEMLR